MNSGFSNVYEDEQRAEAYAKLEFPGTYYLAYRDLPAILETHVLGRKAMDFGCGTGRSTRFLRKLGFDVLGVDIAERMLARAWEGDPNGEYSLITEDGLEQFAAHTYDLILSAFTFDNIPTLEKKVSHLKDLKRLLKGSGRIVNLVSSPEIYVNEWASFTTREFPENRSAKSGDTVRIVMLDVEDSRPVEDVIFSDEDYQKVYKLAELVPIKTYKPLATGKERFQWVSETTIPPWIIYVLGSGD
jgi:ubiquinone/menaquinone biosynthesis C-methylase UbiE